MLHYGELISLTVFAIALLTISYTDIRHRRIPNILVIGAFALLLVMTFFNDATAVLPFLSYAAIGFGAIWALRMVSGGRIGMGDVKLSGLIAASIGLIGWLFALFVASLSGLLGALLLISSGRITKGDAIPFAPFLAAGSLCFILLEKAFDLSAWILK